MNLHTHSNSNALRSADLLLRKDGILEINFKDFTEVSYRDARELLAAISAFLPEGGPVLFRYGLGIYITNEARIELTNARAISRAAFLTYTQTSTLLANFLLRYSETTYAAQVFQSKTLALTWLTAHT